MAGKGQEKYWLALLRAPGVGSRTCLRLLERFAHPATLFSAPRAELEACGLKPETLSWLGSPDWSAVEADLLWLEQPRNHLITLDDPAYPTLLRETPDPPPVLFVHGDPQRLQTPQLAMVGSRNPSVPARLHQFGALADQVVAAPGEGIVDGAGDGEDLPALLQGLARRDE